MFKFWGKVSPMLILALALLNISVYSLDMRSAKEMKCFEVKNTVPVDGAWATSIEAIYYTWMSRGDLYRAATELLQKKPEDILESSVYYDSCMRWNIFANGTISVSGFGNRTRDYKVTPIKPAPLEQFRFEPTNGRVFGYSGVKYTTLTDNSTFLFTPFCTEDGQMTWGLGSTVPSLPKETVDRVLAHAESLGFSREYFTEVRYDSCGF